MASLFLVGSKIGSHLSQHQYSPIYVLHFVSLSRIISAVANDYGLFNRPWQETHPLSDATGVYYDTQTEPIRQETNDQESPVILNSKLAMRCIPWSSCSSQSLSYCRRLTSDARSLFLHSPVCHKASVWIIDTPSELHTWPGYHRNIH